MNLPGSGVHREECLPAIRKFLESRLQECRSEGKMLWVGVDSAMSVAKELTTGHDTWQSWLYYVKGNHAHPEMFREECIHRAARNGSKEPKRTCDYDAKTPFAPQNLRMYRQTYYAMTELAWPFIEQGIGAVVPMMDPCMDKINIFECCPASLLKHSNKALYKPYKGRTKEHYSARQAILQALLTGTMMQVPIQFIDPKLKQMLLKDAGGDALDAILCAACLASCAGIGPLPRPRIPWKERFSEEGCVYF